MNECNKCNKQFKFNSELKRHQKQKKDCSQIIEYKCELCDVTFNYKSKLLEHEKTKNHQIQAAEKKSFSTVTKGFNDLINKQKEHINQLLSQIQLNNEKFAKQEEQIEKLIAIINSQQINHNKN